MLEKYGSFGRYPKLAPSEVKKLYWSSDIPDLSNITTPILAYGLGKSYGDSCLNEGGVLLDTSSMNKFIEFNIEQGIIRVEAGVKLSDVLKISVPNNWFLASTPGTKEITVGGALANDVHGKNHHKGGTFGCHVTQFELLRSDGKRYLCTPDHNAELFRATIGGMGLTGLVTWVEFKLAKIPSPFIKYENIKFDSLEEFYEINKESENNYDYIVSWVDCGSKGDKLGRGIFMRGNFADPHKEKLPRLPKEGALPFPIDINLINPLTVKGFNWLYFNKQIPKFQSGICHYNPFFYPLDSINGWQKAYGKKGFLQYQFVLPFDNYLVNLKNILSIIQKSGMQSFLTVLKKFGDVRSPGMMSFPMPGITLAIDFPMHGEKTLAILRETDKILRSAGARMYPAKDARMNGADFRNFYPELSEFVKYIDPKYSSSFWRRVMK